MQILTHLLNPFTLGCMLSGCVLIALMQNGVKALARGFAALPCLWRADPERDMLLARATMTRVDHVAQLRGLQCTDRVRAANPFLALAIRKLADTETVDRFEMWAEQALSDRRARHETAHKFWLSIADVAPALGMAGTIIGLVGMFAGMDDPAKIGPSMGLALLTTFYGVVLANLVAVPIATRLTDLSERELAWQTELCQRMLRVARRETAPVRRASIREVA
ncbi:MAG: MotA/TolQ/ExbB proton channel family protein [Sphingobium sp.]|nr:MotA/TolQ/ExbB proton channel family protein [Sphingobium sp.]MBP6112387.1 MotA/TolQ/ExbB proton channel family protein [Sphingobium sp.]MBP9156247.1 MotA/TolQ/ExbB proton channel family protein [Sphingobium sp.]MCC6482423.1 MotA/TolQ/ExbB proton channel family protein [Sphingomonadaceae bacterium]